MSLLFVVYVASFNDDLRVTLGQFVAKCEVAGMRISTSKSEAMALCWKRVE